MGYMNYEEDKFPYSEDSMDFYQPVAIKPIPFPDKPEEAPATPLKS